MSDVRRCSGYLPSSLPQNESPNQRPGEGLGERSDRSDRLNPDPPRGVRPEDEGGTGGLAEGDERGEDKSAEGDAK